MGDIVPRKSLVKYGSQGVGGIIGGIVLLALNGMGGIGSLIVGGMLAVVGLVVSRSDDDKTTGQIATVAGLITAATAIPVSFISGIAGFLLGVSGVGLLIAGGINLVKFLRGYKKRV